MLLLFLLLLLLLLLQFFCSNEPGPQGKWRKRAQGLDWSLKGPDACAIAARSINWFILEGNAGYKVCQSPLTIIC